MKSRLELIIKLVGRNEVLISDHGYDELAEDNIYVNDIIDNLSNAEVIEDYPEYTKGPCILLLQNDENGFPIHVV